MSTALRSALVALHLLSLLVLPFFLVGLINRVKALWAGRRGPPLWQSLYDVVRLLQKRPVYSRVTTGLFQLGPLVVLAATLVSGLFVPLLGAHAPLSFHYDFVAVAYLWGLGRVFLMLSALDTGSAFEGMGATREATFGALVEPALFVALGALSAASGQTSLAPMAQLGLNEPVSLVLSLSLAVALLSLALVESARVPVDDPNTHLELTMIHEVMVLDHSGPELAALQTAAAMKLTLAAGLVASVLNPVDASPLARAGANLGLTLGVAVLIGFVESLMARIKLKVVPRFIALSLLTAFLGLLAASLKRGAA